MATHSSIIPRKISWTEEPGRNQFDPLYSNLNLSESLSEQAQISLIQFKTVNWSEPA